MRLGYSVGSLMGSGDIVAHAELARAAERLGYHSLWSAELAGVEPIGVLGWLAGQTSTIKLGTAVLQLSGRSAVATAAGAATLAQISGDRFVLGLGATGPQVAEGWHGQRYDHPLARTRDYVMVLRAALAGEPVQYAGQTLTLPLPGSQAEALPFLSRRRAVRVPLYLAGLGPKAIALAGELADGWLGIHCPPSYVAQVRESLGSPSDFDIAVMVLAVVDEDEDLARDIARPQLALYVGGMGTSKVNFYTRLAERLGFGAASAAVREAYLAGRIDEAIDLLPDEMVDAMTLCGTPARVRERLLEYQAAGTGTLIVGMFAPSARMRQEQLERIAAFGVGVLRVLTRRPAGPARAGRPRIAHCR